MNTWNPPLYFELDEVETIAEEEATITLDYSPPVILPDDVELVTHSSLATNEAESIAQPIIAPVIQANQSTSPWLWLVGSLGLLLVFMLLLDTYYFVIQQFSSSLLLGILFLGLIVTAIAATLMLSWRAYQNIRTLRTVAALQREGQKLIEIDAYGNAIPYLNKIVQFYNHRPEVKTRLESFYLNLNDSYHDRELCHLFSTHVIKEIDQQAYGIVVQRSKETALMVMISQIAILDAVLTLWRNVRMIRDVATLYGGRPGFLGSMSLITAVLQNLIYADVSELVAESVAEILGGSMLSIMSAQAAQGLGSGVMTARVGLQAIKACRPLPFSEEEKPRLRDIRKEIVKSLKGIFETKEAQVKTA